MTFQERIIKESLKQLGKDYIWAGKGDLLWTLKGLVPAKFYGFDCIGLIMFAMRAAGGPDWRGTHNAQTLYDYLTKRNTESVDSKRPHLRYYGKDTKHIEHIALAVAYIDTDIIVVEAAGGGHLTVEPTKGAYVRCNFETRLDYVGSTLLPVF